MMLLYIVGTIWLTGAALFVLGLALAAKRPMPRLETDSAGWQEDDTVDPEPMSSTRAEASRVPGSRLIVPSPIH